MNDKFQKFFTYFLAVVFFICFILIGVGSCGGIRYLRDQRSDNVVYADTGSSTTEVYTSTLSVPVQAWFDYVNYYDPIADEDIEQVYGSIFMPFVFVQTNTSLVIRCAYSTYSDTIDRYIDVDLYSGDTVLYNVLSNERELRSIAFGITSVSSSFKPTNGKLLGVYVNIPVGEGDPSGSLPIEFTCVFESGVNISFGIVPYRYELVDDGVYAINRLYNFSGIFYYQMPGAIPNLSEVLANGYNQGFIDGKNVGYREGKNDGIIEGASTANNYSFLGLLTAVFDVPIKSFTGLLSFELFGFDMAILYKSLFAVSIVILLLRLFI